CLLVCIHLWKTHPHRPKTCSGRLFPSQVVLQCFFAAGSGFCNSPILRLMLIEYRYGYISVINILPVCICAYVSRTRGTKSKAMFGNELYWPIAPCSKQ